MPTLKSRHKILQNRSPEEHNCHGHEIETLQVCIPTLYPYKHCSWRAVTMNYVQNILIYFSSFTQKFTNDYKQPSTTASFASGRAICSRLCCSSRRYCAFLNMYPVIITLYMSCAKFSAT